MKKSLIILSILFFTGISYSQCPVSYPNEITFFRSAGGSDSAGFNLSVFGEDSEKLKEAIISKYSNYKLRGSRYHIKNVLIPGIDKPVNIEVYQGIHEKTDNGSSFHSFKNLKEKKEVLSNVNTNQSLGVNIYFKRKRKNAFKTIEEAGIAKTYLESLYED